MKNKFESPETEIEGKKKQNKHHFKEEDFPSPKLNKHPPDKEEEEINLDIEKEISYLDIFRRPSFRNVRRNIMSTEPNAELITVNDIEQEGTKKTKYDYPVNIFKNFFLHGQEKY